MMKKTVLFCPILSLIALLSGCGVPYVLVEGGSPVSLENFEVVLPDGWRRHDLTWDQDPMSQKMLDELQERRSLTWDQIRVTRDGLALQQMGIGSVGIDEELLHTKKKLSKGMLPQEVAGVIIDNVRSNPNITNQQFTENAPAKVGGYRGFRLLYTYRTKQGLKIKVAYYGVLLDGWFYYLVYEAAARHYFSRDYPLFEKVKGSFTILKGNGVETAFRNSSHKSNPLDLTAPPIHNSKDLYNAH